MEGKIYVKLNIFIDVDCDC